MSGRQIGSAVGFVVGLYFGNPQLGMMIGGMIGGAVDPDKIQGAKIGELPVQRSLTGGIQPIVLGTSLVDSCLIMWAGAPRIVKEKEQQGKGGGPVVINEVMYQSYRVRVCRSSLADGSQVQGFPVIFEDGRVVYDMRPNPRISRADSAKWAENVRFYFGGPDQEPDPTEESDVGVGNVSAHRQIASFVKHNQKMTDFGNRIPTYEVVVSKCPAEVPLAQILVTGQEKSGGVVWCTADAEVSPTFTGLNPATGANMPIDAFPAYHNGMWCVHRDGNASGNRGVRYSNNNMESWDSATSVSTGRTEYVGATDSGWLIFQNSLDPVYLTESIIPSVVRAATTAEYNACDWPSGVRSSSRAKVVNGYYYLTYNRALWRSDKPQGPYSYVYWSGSPYWDLAAEDGDANPNGDSIQNFSDLCQIGDKLWGIVHFHFNAPLGWTGLWFSEYEGYRWRWQDVVKKWYPADTDKPLQLCECDGALIVLCVGGVVWTSANNFTTPSSTGIGVGITGSTEKGRRIASKNGLVFVINDDKCVVSADKGITWGPPVTMPIQAAYGIAAGDESFFIPDGTIGMPDSGDYFIDPLTGEVFGPEGATASVCGTTLDEVVRYICKRGQLDDAEIDTSELEGIIVRGVTLQSPGTCKDELDPLRQAHFFDPSDFDGKLRFHRRGSAVVDMTIPTDDLVLTENADDEDRIIGQEVEFSRKHWLNYLSLDLDYLRTGAPSERISLDPTIVGESESSANEVFTHEEAMRIAAIQHRLLWMAREGYRKFGLPLEYLPLVGASLIELDGRRGRVDGYSIDMNAIWFDPVPYDRASAYSAHVVAPVLTPPSDGTSGIAGPTLSAVMNIPALRDDDDRAGVYWAATGPSTGWKGAQLQLSRGVGEYENGPEINNRCTMGVLAAELPSASRYGVDNCNTLKVKLYAQSSGLDPQTFDGLIAEKNAAAIVYPNGTVEVIQFQRAVETAEREYDLSILLRGRNDTTPGLHAEGATFVLLDGNVRFVSIRPDDVGQMLKFRAVSLGTDPDANQTQTITMTTIESLREWSPYKVIPTRQEDGGWCVTWIGRARLGTSRIPIHSQWFAGYRLTFTLDGNSYSVETAEQASCVSGETLTDEIGTGDPDITVTSTSEISTTDDDFDSTPAPPGPGTTPPAETPYGLPASTTVGPNGGFPDDAQPDASPPSTFGTDLIDGATTGWVEIDGTALNPHWSVDGGGKVMHTGRETTFPKSADNIDRAVFWPARYLVPTSPLPRYSVTMSANVRTDPGAEAALGVMWSDGNYRYYAVGDFTEYVEEATVTHVWELELQYGMHSNFIATPVLLTRNTTDDALTTTFDSPAMEISAVSIPATVQTPSHLDIDAGLTGWKHNPNTGGVLARFSSAAGAISWAGDNSAPRGQIYCLDPLDLDGEFGKYAHITAEVWCNDPKTVNGRTVSGVMLGIAAVNTSGNVAAIHTKWGATWQHQLAEYERGDWTTREAWVRIPGDGTVGSFHVCACFQAFAGYSAKVRNITVEVTDDPVPLP